MVDFTNPEAVAWYKGKLKGLLDMGVDSFKTDFGERIPTDAVYYDGSDPEKMHNYYAYLYNKVVFELLQEERSEKDAVVFARAASVGSQKFPVHWGGDCTSDYPSMAESLRAGLSIGLSGFGFWSHDIGGFEAGCSDDLYKRWTQFGLLSSHSRYHGSWEYKVPWLYGEEAVEVASLFTKLKLRLMPYLYRQGKLAEETGVPMMRAMIMEFPNDITTHALDRQYMFGDNLLVAPIFNENSQGEFYLPHDTGRWTNYLTNEVHESGAWCSQVYDYKTLPLLAKPNSLVMEGAEDHQAEYDYSKNVTVHAFEIETKATAEVTNLSGEVVGSVSVEKTDAGYTVQTNGLTNVSVLFRNRDLASGEIHELGTLVKIESETQLVQ